MQSLKISQTAEHKAGPQQTSSIPSISAIFVAFSIMSECLPYKLMTKKVLQLRHKKTHCVCHKDFPLHLPTGLLSVKSVIDFIKNIHGSRGCRLAKGNLEVHAPVSEITMQSAPTTFRSCYTSCSRTSLRRGASAPK